MVLKRVNFYDQSINNMWEEVLKMGQNVEFMLEEARISLVNRDPSKLSSISKLEDILDSMNEKIEMKALELISLQQPSPRDLRKLAAFMRIIKELERIGDLGLNLGEAAVMLSKTGDYFKPLVDIPKMLKLVQSMIGKALTAYQAQDIALAKETCKMDERIDEMYLYLKDELIEHMKKEPKNTEQACHFLLIARDLERMGDHAENIAEMVNYMVTGQIKICD